MFQYYLTDAFSIRIYSCLTYMSLYIPRLGIGPCHTMGTLHALYFRYFREPCMLYTFVTLGNLACFILSLLSLLYTFVTLCVRYFRILYTFVMYNDFRILYDFLNDF